jgi:hypothetical protein
MSACSYSRKIFFVFSIILFVGTCSKELKASILCPNDSLDELKKLSESLPKVIGLTTVQNIPEFCRVNGFRDLENNINSSNVHDPKNNPWTGNFVAAQDRREAIYHENVTAATISNVQNSVPFTQGQIDSCTSEMEANFKNAVIDADVDKRINRLSATLFCGELTYKHILACAKSMQSTVNLAMPRSDQNLTGVWLEIFKDPNYLKVLKKVALQNHSLIIRNETPKNRLFDDLIEAFNSEIHDKKKATDYTFRLLGALSSNGNNSDSILPCTVPKGFRDAIRMLNLGSVALDRRSAQKGFLYTYPQQVDSLCDYGKNYHFWMSAFLAREAAKESGDISGAAAAVFSLDKGYQFIKSGGGREPSRPFKEGTFSDYNNNIRLDLTQAAAGAWFGARSIQPDSPVINRNTFESGMREVFGGAVLMPKDPNFEFPTEDGPVRMGLTYLKWRKILNPDAAFKYFENSVSK